MVLHACPTRLSSGLQCPDRADGGDVDHSTALVGRHGGAHCTCDPHCTFQVDPKDFGPGVVLEIFDGLDVGADGGVVDEDVGAPGPVAGQRFVEADSTVVRGQVDWNRQGAATERLDGVDDLLQLRCCQIGRGAWRGRV